MTRRYVFDTNVLSELARPSPNPAVLTWIRAQGDYAVTAVSIYEVERGIDRLPSGRKKSTLEDWLARVLSSRIEVLAFDVAAAATAAQLEGEARRRGRTVDVRDLFIVATAKSRDLAVATRNVSHFKGLGVPLYDPFTDTHAI